MALARTFIKGKDGQIKELLSHFNLYTGNVPFVNDAKVKQLPKNSWYDEQGDDEFIPSELMFEAYEMSFEVGYKGAFKSASGVIEKFVNYLAKLGEFSMWCDYNDVGNSSCRFVALSKPTLAISDEDGDIYKWNLTVKVNNPKESWKLTGVVPIEIVLDPSSLMFTSIGGIESAAISVWEHNFNNGDDRYLSPLASDYEITSASPFTAIKQDGLISVTAGRYVGLGSRSVDITISFRGLSKVLTVVQMGRILGV